MDSSEYCRTIETHLCRRNGGHLIRVVGPSFELVSGWATQGIPLKVALAGIDRYFERQARQHKPSRRPVRIDFCDADVLDVFDEWRRAVLVPAGVEAAPGSDAEAAPAKPSASLPAHLERVVLRLSAARARGTLGDAFDALIDRVVTELDTARASVGGVRGDARRELIERLAALDRALIDGARARLDDSARAALSASADEELAEYRERMPAGAFARAHAAVLDRLVRERLSLPIVSYP